jgi:hypothetical protein
MVKTFITALLLAITLGAPALPVSGQTPPASPNINSLQARLHARFDILPIANGVVLTPKFKTTVRAIEVTDRTIAVDGTVVTGAELRDKLGADAELIFQLSYLDPASRRSLLGVNGGPAGSPSGAPPAVSEPAIQPDITPNPPRANRRGDVVRFGGSVVVNENETINGDVVVIGGSATVDGHVQGDVVVVGGSMALGPHADVRGDAVTVGGTLSRDPGAKIGGEVTEVGVGDAIRGRRNGSGVTIPRGWDGWQPGVNRPGFSFVGTLVRLGLLMLLTAIVLLVARVPVQQIADRAAAEPLKSWAVGFLMEILFVPVLVITVVVLAISIIGIPLLLLVPVAIVAAILVFLVGFTGVAYHLGRMIEGQFDLRDRPYSATFVGIGAIMAPLLLGRLIGLFSGLGILVGLLVGVGIVVEYVAWTTGVGAAALVRFAKPQPPLQPPVAEGLSPVGPALEP